MKYTTEYKETTARQSKVAAILNIIRSKSFICLSIEDKPQPEMLAVGAGIFQHDTFTDILDAATVVVSESIRDEAKMNRNLSTAEKIINGLKPKYEGKNY